MADIDVTASAVGAEAGVARGGKAIYGAPLGVLMLEAAFPRIPGDMGNALTWPFPVLYQVVRGATPQRVVLEGAAGLLDDFWPPPPISCAWARRGSPRIAAFSRCSSASWRRMWASRSRPAR